MNWEKLKFLVFETTWIGDFVQLSLIWWNWLVLLHHFIIIYYFLTCVMINWLICWNFWKWVFKIWVFDINSMFKPILYFFKYNWITLTALEHASCVNTVHVSYRLLFSLYIYFFALTASDAVYLWVFFFSFFFCLFSVYPIPTLASWLGRLEPIGHPLPFLLHPLIVRSF